MTDARDPADAELLSFLAQRYGTLTAARALWQWAGGEEGRVFALAQRPPRWPALWAEACDPGSDSEVSDVSLLREALLDHKSDPLLLDVLAGIALARFERLTWTADLVLVALARLAPFDFPTAPLRAVLASFGAAGWDEAFAALAPACDEWLGAKARARLAERCRGLEPLGGVVGDLLALRDELREVVEDEEAGAEEQAEATQAVVDALVELSVRAARVKLDGDDPLRTTLARGVERLERRLSFRSTPRPKSALGGLSSLLVALDVPIENHHTDVSAAAEGLRLALWGTVPDLFAEEEPEEEEGGIVMDGVPAAGPSEGEQVGAGYADLGEPQQVDRGASD